MFNLLRSGWNNLELSLYVTPKYARFQSFDMAANVCFGCQEMSLVHVSILFFMTIRHNDMSTKGLYLNTVSAVATPEGLYGAPSGVSHIMCQSPF
jgi:hypothetical protein